jgi:para-aminobenzoate N-oxygenase AurF
MSETPALPRTARRSAQLVAASERTTLDPFVDVDWSVPIDDSAFHLPPEWLPLYGTPAWEAMPEADRVTYSRHEAAALCGAGIWFENLLMQSVLRHLAELPVTHPAHRYLLVEVADECRHSTMFGEFIRRAGTPAYRPARTAGFGGMDGLPGGQAMSYLLILAVEELLDAANRATMNDERVHSVARQVARLHVLEEARHVSFAKTYLAEVWPTLSAEDRGAAVDFAPIAVNAIAELIVDPDVYRTLDIEDGVAQARANPNHRARIAEGLAKLTGFLTQLGVIDDERRPVWRGLGLVA